MISTFLKHELKAFWRSKNTGKNLAVRIVMAVLILYLLLNVVVIGFFMDNVLKSVFPHDGLILSFCGIILIYFLGELFSRLQLQELPTLRVQPYLQLPIKRNTIVGYLALTALFSVFNLWPIVLFFPFIFKVVLHDAGLVTALAFIVSILGITVLNNYLALYIKRKANLNGWIFLIVAAIMILIGLSDFKWHIISIRNISYLFFGHLMSYPVLALLPVLLGAGMYFLNFTYLKKNLYLEELSTKKDKFKSSTEYPILSYFGSTGDLVANEIKLVLRNKRPRSALVMSLFFLLYGLFFYPNPALRSNEGFKIFVGMFMTGIFIINYGQFMFSWQASHFDGLMVSKVNFADFLRGKYLLFTTASTVAFLLTIPYVYFGWRVLLIHFIMYLWNLGFTVNVVLYFANRNAKRIDLSKGASFNWEGVGATQLMLSFLLLLPPLIIYIPFKYFKYEDVGLALIGAIGLTGILTRSFWVKFLEADFYKRKFTILEGFRNK
ncbi:hypothetical protein FO440_03920 [Mucilaginibacter corticis]|uniref:Uncharacterized protein n=1 Tax=Mucilaginibacter corticis TaxID=2597670 RepID=A0A556MTS3_9SPHI|nr:DUF5687 family protein [Mucilaginibacter corticis]TSJ43350.1 hypothetical protein FO440_03920 [Mucilaginibacter corticis]